MKTILAFILLISVASHADNMGDNQKYKINDKYKVGSFVLINLKDHKLNGKCSGLGTVSHFANGKYYIKKVACKGKFVDFIVEEYEILDVFSEKDFKEDGRFEQNGLLRSIFFMDNKYNRLWPCMRNKFDEDKKEELCEKNKYMFY